MDASHLDPRGPIGKQGRKGGLIDGADAGQQVDAMFFLDVTHGVGPWKPAPQPHLHIFIGSKAGAAPAAECLSLIVFSGIS